MTQFLLMFLRNVLFEVKLLCLEDKNVDVLIYSKMEMSSFAVCTVYIFFTSQLKRDSFISKQKRKKKYSILSALLQK